LNKVKPDPIRLNKLVDMIPEILNSMGQFSDSMNRLPCNAVTGSLLVLSLHEDVLFFAFIMFAIKGIPHTENRTTRTAINNSTYIPPLETFL